MMKEKWCNGCGNPPLPNEKLLVCRGCHKAWYHNSDCQRRDWRVRHKAQCRGTTTSSSSTSNGGDTNSQSQDTNSNSNSSSSHRRYVEARQDRSAGSWGIWCCHDMTKRHRIVNEANALVNPVLVTSERHVRCSYCFQKLVPIATTPTAVTTPTATTTTAIPSSPIHWHCNTHCRTHDTFWEWESQVVCEQQRHQKPLPTPTLLYVLRILRSTTDIQSIITHSFSSNLDKLSSDEYQHCEAIAHLTLLLLARTPLQNNYTTATTIHNLTAINIHTIIKIVSIIMMNAFNITEGEGIVPVGIGLYPTEVSRFNHSCEPKAVQTFKFLPTTSPPKLNITTTTHVKVKYMQQH
jgi:hypothetical protein